MHRLLKSTITLITIIMLTCKQLSHFISTCNLTMSAKWILIAQCFITKASVAMDLIMHWCIFSCLWVKQLIGLPAINFTKIFTCRSNQCIYYFAEFEISNEWLLKIFYTLHDFGAVMSCVQLNSKITVMGLIKTKHNFYVMWIVSQKLLVKWAWLTWYLFHSPNT